MITMNDNEDDANRAHLLVTNTHTGETLLDSYTNDGQTAPDGDRPKDPRRINEYTGYQVHKNFEHERDVYFASWDGGISGFPYPTFYTVVRKKSDGDYAVYTEKGGLTLPAVRCDKMVVVQ